MQLLLWAGYKGETLRRLNKGRGLSFTMDYVHLKANQDDKHSYSKLSRKAQLNCMCDHAAKVRISTDGMKKTASGQMFPLEPVGIFVDNQNMTSDTGDYIQFWAHRRLARIYCWRTAFQGGRLFTHTAY